MLLKSLFITLVILLLAGTLQAELIIVDNDGIGDFDNIREAVQYTTDNDIIVILPGTYTGTNNCNIDFEGKAITIQSVAPEDPYIVSTTVVDCGGSQRGFYFHSGEAPNAVLNGLTISNGYADNGGAIYCESSTPTIKNCILSNNTVTTRGGAVACRFNGNPIITNCNVIDNLADSGGGGISCHYSSPTITDCVIERNTSNVNGGGVFSYYSQPEIINCTINNNTASGGGGIELKQSEAVLSMCTISNNTATLSYGGGLSCWNNVIITSCIITGNTASWVGGGVYCENDSSELISCVIAKNSSGSKGGGIYYKYNNSIIRNCTITDNSASQGRAIHYKDSSLNIKNTIIWNGNNQIQDEGGSNITATYCDIQGGWTGLGNLDSEPCFVNPVVEDYHISGRSFCINNGEPDYQESLNEIDIDGQSRVSMDAVDIGADEFLPDSPFIQVTPFSILFYHYKGLPNPEPQILSIRNIGVGTMLWEIVEDCDWLEVSPTSGMLSDDINNVCLTVDANLLEIGNYNCILNVVDSNAANNPLTLSIDLHVGSVLYIPSQFPTLQQAIDAASDYDMLLAENGIYSGQGNINLDLKGKKIRVCSENGADDCIIDCQYAGRAFLFNSGETENTIVEGFTITKGYADFGGGMYCEQSSPAIYNCIIKNSVAYFYGGGIYTALYSEPTITHCTVINNDALSGGGIYCLASEPVLKNCIFAENRAQDDGGGLLGCNGPILNCTIYNNFAGDKGGGLYRCNDRITNCIIGNNIAQNQGSQLYRSGKVTYSCVEGGWLGLGNINVNPCFADPAADDYHLKSQGWRWDPKRKRWDYDETTSRCIDAGNPAWELDEELLSVPDDPDNIWGRNIRINMGAFGGTTQASMPPYGWSLLADLNNDGIVNLKDYSFLTANWLRTQNQLTGDIDRNGIVTINDLLLLAEIWLDQTSWFEL